jgi:hypothetical protein
VNPKWQIKINKFNAKTAVKILLGLQMSKNSTNKKVLTHLSVVKTAVRKREQTLTETEEAEVIVARDNRSQSLVLSVVHKIQYLSNREVTRLFCAETVLESNKARNMRLPAIRQVL